MGNISYERRVYDVVENMSLGYINENDRKK